MKILHLIGTLTVAGVLHAQAENLMFTNYVNAPIPDDNPAGLSSLININGVNGLVGDVNVFITITGGYTGDLYAWLAGQNGGYAVLLNRLGKTSANPFGYEDSGLNIMLDDEAGADVHVYGGNLGAGLLGTWQPDGRAVNPQTVLDSDDRTSL